MVASEPGLHLEQVQHGPTSVTVVAKEYEADVRVASKSAAASGIVLLELREAGGHPLPVWEPGAHVDLILGNGAPTRQYSLCGDPADRLVYRLGILRDAEGGGGSTYVHDRLAEGDVVRIRGPRNNFPLVPAASYLFIAGGIGVTPLVPMIAAAEAAGANWRLHYGAHTRAGMAFADELSAYGERVSLHARDGSGRMVLDQILGTPEEGTLVYCCGPERLVADVEAHCRVWPARSLHVERFDAKPADPDAVDTEFEVVLRRSSLTLTIPAGKSILDTVEAAGVGVMSSCGKGTCGTCETNVLEGVPDHRDSVLNEDERALNEFMMICCSRSRTPQLVLDL
jgi:ferredoxin-NADP reductase